MNDDKRNGGRRGIALIVVLGLMAMLVILGVAFATTMRTEHRAARMSGDQLGSMEMVYYGLAEALYHLETDSEKSGWVAPTWPKFTIHSGMNETHPDKLTWGAVHDLLTWYGAWFVPQSIIGGPPPNDGLARDETNNVRWIRVKSPEGKIVGQFAYMIIDCTGFIDPNGNYHPDPAIATNRPRYLGTNVAELALTNTILPEMRRGHERKLISGRVGGGVRARPYGRVETLADLRTVGYMMYPDFNSVGRESPMSGNRIASNFFCFSYFPPGYADPQRNAKPQVDLRGTGADLHARIAEIKAACAGVVPNTEIDTFINNLIDYVDADYVPGGLASAIAPGGNNADSFCTEPVPMLNELQIGCVYQLSGGNYSLRTRVQTELFFPFLFTSNAITAPPPSPLQLRFRARLEGGTFEPKDWGVQTVNIPWNNSWWVKTAPAPAADPGGNQLPVITLSPPVATAPMTNAVPPERLVITEWSLVDAQGRVLDRLAPGANGVIASLKMSEYLSDQINNPQRVYCGWEVNDPRMNWRGSDLTDPNPPSPRQWQSRYKAQPLINPNDPNQTSMGRINPTAAKENGEWTMYVSNGPLYSIGELGYLLYRTTRPWGTISFFGPQNTLTVLDRFTLTPYDRQGLISINTRIPRVLATAFNECPIELAPGIPQQGADPPRLTPAEAIELAMTIVNKRTSNMPLGFLNMSDFRFIPELGQATTVSRVKSWMAREGLIRNTIGLLGVRQNVFLINLVGLSLKQYTNPESANPNQLLTTRLAGHRAIATVWRDPYKVNGRHRIHVRNFRWYDEWIGAGEDFDPGVTP